MGIGGRTTMRVSHADILRCFDVAIAMAEAREALQTSSRTLNPGRLLAPRSPGIFGSRRLGCGGHWQIATRPTSDPSQNVPPCLLWPSRKETFIEREICGSTTG
jgi:hypothetical protein